MHAAGIALMICASVLSAESVMLWPEGTPQEGGTADAAPTLSAFLPPADRANGAAVIVCPGGGYGGLAMGYEGTEVAEWLNGHGVAGFVLTYRHRGTGYGHPAPLHDAQRAIRTVRARAAEWGIDSGRIGILGFSAGGHLASTAGTHWVRGQADATDPIERVSSRPDFMVLCYPVISLTAPFTHQGSKRNLLGEEPDPALAASLSSELQVTAETPPAFILHTDEDTGVAADNAISMYQALHAAGVPAELHIYRQGPHGVGLGQAHGATGQWPAQCIAWMQGMGFLTGPSSAAGPARD